MRLASASGRVPSRSRFCRALIRKQESRSGVSPTILSSKPSPNISAAKWSKESTLMNIKQLMRQAQQMQEEIQEKLASLRVEGTSGGGMVKAEMSGQKELLSLRIEKEAVDPNDVEMLQDLIV